MIMNWKRLVGDCLFAVALLGFVVLLLWGLSGCASVNIEVQHTSHLSQHFGDQRHYGFNAIGVDVRGQRGCVSVDVFEGAVLGACGTYYDSTYCEGLYGSREVFNARLDVALWSKP